MHSIRTKLTSLTMSVIILTLCIATTIAVVSIRNLGRSDADEMIRLTCTTGALNLETYFESVENSVEMISMLVQDSFEGVTLENLDSQIENARHLFERASYITHGVLTYYFRIDPQVSQTAKGFWYVYQDGVGFREHEVTDISQYDTNDTSALVWFTVPKATGKGLWLPPYFTENLDVRVISYNVPVYWEGRFIGVIGIEIDYGTLVREAEKIKIFESGYAFILDDESNVIYHPHIGSAKLDLEKDALDNGSTYSDTRQIRYTYDGITKQAVWMKLSNGMRLYVAAPLSEINSRWFGMIWKILIASLVILVIVCFVMMNFASHLTKPLRDLTEAAIKADHGDYGFTLEYNKDDEVGVLMNTFKELAAHTQDNLTTARKMAVNDSLTGVKNKHAYVVYEEKINAEIEKGEQEPFAVVVCDVNNLKTVNDLYGHKEGDACIRKASATITATFPHSPVFRTGGDEFVVLLSGEDYAQRTALMEKINTLPEDRSKIKIGETIAAGMVEYNKDHHPSLLSVFEEADKAMYERKQYIKETYFPEYLKHESEEGPEYISVINTRKHLLIADDMEINRQMMGASLKEDYDISYATNGIETLEILRAHKDEIDLVLLDMKMPGKSGREVLAEMQIDEDLMTIPVIVFTVDQDSELDCLKSGAIDFIPKPYPTMELVKARIARCIELSEDRELIRYTERDKLTGLLNKDYFLRYVNRLDHIYKDNTLDAVAFDVNRFHSVNKLYGRQFGDRVLKSIGASVRKLAHKTGGIGCRMEGDIFLLYCPHQIDYEELFKEFLSEIYAEGDMADKVILRFGVFADARQVTDIEERFIRAKIAADRVKDDPQNRCGFYDQE